MSILIMLTSGQTHYIFGSRIYGIALSTERQAQLGILREGFILTTRARSWWRLVILSYRESSNIGCLLLDYIRCHLGELTHSILVA